MTAAKVNADEHVWDVAAKEVQLSALQDALSKSHGNISQAAKTVGISRSHAMRLVKKYELTEFAAKLRLKHGIGSKVQGGERTGVVLGRPRKQDHSR